MRNTNGTARCATRLAAILALVAGGLLAGGCASLRPAGPGDGAQPSGDALAARCDRAYAALDRAVADAGVGDAMAARVAGFPFLRVDRFLASYRDSLTGAGSFDFWVAAMARLDREARAIEIANLPVATTRVLRGELAREGFGDLLPVPLLEGCADALGERDLATADGRARLVAAAVVPDDYVAWMRVAGLYPLTALPFALGVRRYEAEVRAAFAVPLEARPATGRLRSYRPRDPALVEPGEVRAMLDRARRNPLGIPLPSPEELDRLFPSFAPILVVEERDDDDRIGRPAWRPDGSPGVDTTAPVVFTRVAHTRVSGEALLQLVYTAWFPARPPASAFDPLAGRLDGIVWRVTLGADGTPLLYDTIHACGCYQLFFPTERLAPRPAAPTIEEGALIPQAPEPVAGRTRLAIRIESGTHYVRRISADTGDPADAVGYALSPDDALRSLPLAGGGRRSLYGPDGLVAGSERFERFLFWPMGIASAGAMRQWGRHATAFVGRRHFDEPDLIDRYFHLKERGR